MNLLTPKQAAAILSMSTETLRNWEADGRIKSQRTPGGHRRFVEADVEALAKSIAAGTYNTSQNRVSTAELQSQTPESKEANNDREETLSKNLSLIMLRCFAGLAFVIATFSLFPFSRSFWFLIWMPTFLMTLTYAVTMVLDVPKCKWSSKQRKTLWRTSLIIIPCLAVSWISGGAKEASVDKDHSQAILLSFDKTVKATKLDCARASKEFEIKTTILQREVQEKADNSAIRNNGHRAFTINKYNQQIKDEASLANASCLK